MRLNEAILETGVFGTSEILDLFADQEDTIAEAGYYIPRKRGFSTSDRMHSAAKELVSLGKDKLLFTSIEYALIEEMLRIGWEGESILVLTSAMEAESRERVLNNAPMKARVTFIEEGCFPRAFTFNNGALVTVGYSSSNNCQILRLSYRLLLLFQAFDGANVLLSCFDEGVSSRAYNWTSAYVSDFFTWVFKGDQL